MKRCVICERRKWFTKMVGTIRMCGGCRKLYNRVRKEHEMNCIDCPFVRRAFMERVCVLTGKHVPLFSAPHECPMNQDKEEGAK